MASDILNTADKKYAPPSAEDISLYRKWIRECPEPYTKEELLNLDLDDPSFSYARDRAFIAREILTEYDIPFEEDDTTE